MTLCCIVYLNTEKTGPLLLAWHHLNSDFQSYWNLAKYLVFFAAGALGNGIRFGILWFINSILEPSSLAKGYDPLYSSSPLASLDGFSRSHGDGLYVMKLVVAATNPNALYTSCLRANKDIFSVYNSRYRFALIVCQWFHIKFFTNLRLKISHIIISSQFSGHSNERKWKPCVNWLKMTSLQGA